MKTVLLTFLILGSTSAFAGKNTLHCLKTTDLAVCADRAETALKGLGCMVDESKTTCDYSLIEDPKKPGATIESDSPYCRVISSNCSGPRVDTFSDKCDGNTKMLNIPRSAKVNNGHWFGIFGSYSRVVCKAQ